MTTANGRTRPRTASAGSRNRSTGDRRPSTRSSSSLSRRGVAGGEGRSSSRPSNRRGSGRRSSTGRASSRRRKLPATDVGERNAAALTAVFVVLALFGLVMVLSASSVTSMHQVADSPFYQFSRQAMWAGIGVAAFVVATRLDYRVLRRLAGPLLLLTLGLLVVVLIPGVGVSVNGSTRWLGVGTFVVQPSELAKLSLIIFVADLLAKRERRMDRPELTVRPVMLVLLAVSGLIVLQPKLGTPIVLAAVAWLMLFVAGAKLSSLVTWASGLAASGAVLAMAVSYRQDRLTSFLDPWADPQGDGFQIIQSQVGIASGGIWGVGLGASRAKWGFLPEAHSDFIFAIVAEEVGMMGASAVIAAFVLIAFFGVRAALGAPDRFGMLLAAGITIWLVFQAFLNIAIVLGVLPTTGEPLPFVSAGGSSLVTTLAAAGLLVGVARRAKEPSSPSSSTRSPKAGQPA